MKAISIKEPWATLILNGLKTIETRTWKTNYRGKILLCASKNPKSNISGHAFATAEIERCMPMKKGHEEMACCEIYPRANSWFLKNVKPIKPFEVKGQLGIFNVEYEEDMPQDEDSFSIQKIIMEGLKNDRHNNLHNTR